MCVVDTKGVVVDYQGGTIKPSAAHRMHQTVSILARGWIRGVGTKSLEQSMDARSKHEFARPVPDLALKPACGTHHSSVTVARAQGLWVLVVVLGVLEGRYPGIEQV